MINIPDFLKSTQEMLLKAFPDGISEECYWALLYLLYDHMADENLALVMASVVEKPLEMIANDIYKVYYIEFDKRVIQWVECRLNKQGFEEWKKEG